MGCPISFFLAHHRQPDYLAARVYWWKQFEPIEDEI